MGCAFGISLLATMGSPAAVGASAETSLVCQGEISVHPDSGNATTNREENVSLRVQNDKVIVSGNLLFTPTTAVLCSNKNDTVFFDSQGCGQDTNLNKSRTYGTLNKVSGDLVLSYTPDLNEFKLTHFWLIEGHFVCRKAQPILD